MILKIKELRFAVIVVLMVIMAFATVLEVTKGSGWILQHIYHNIGFMGLWGAAFLLFLFCEISQKNYKKKPFRLGFIIAVGIVLTGGLVTFLSGKSENIHLRKNEPLHYDVFHITLSDFKIQYYQGTTTPINYESLLIIRDKNQNIPVKVSVNHPVAYKGYRFYQISYDNDLNGSVLAVSYNPVGNTLFIMGYLLVTLLIIAKLIFHCWKWRKRAVFPLFLLLFMLLPQCLSAQKTVSKEEGEAIGRLAIYYRGRIAPLNTYATDFTRKLTGKSTYKNFSAEQVLIGWLFYPEIWQREPMMKIKNKRVMEMEEQLAMIAQLHNRSSLKLFPQKERWYAPIDNLDDANPQDTLFIANILQFLYESIEQEQHAQTADIIAKIAFFQQTRCEAAAISKNKIEAEILLNTTPFLAILFPILLTLALLIFGYSVCPEIVQKKLRLLPVFMRWSLFVVEIALTLFLLLRTYITEHLPLGNSYETLLLLAWLVLFLTLFLGKKSILLLFGGQLLAGFTLLTANLIASNPQISSLMPVLHSPWLAVHVSLMMFSYSLLAFIFIIAVIYWIIQFYNKNQQHLQPLTKLSKSLLPPAMALLALGIMAGSVWANLTWGRFWGWDPKEVWALVTLLGYGLALYGQDIFGQKKDQTYHLLMLIGFGLVLITYFGVNVWFSGLHSY